jgi:hypothetical protein
MFFNGKSTGALEQMTLSAVVGVIIPNSMLFRRIKKYGS